MCPACVANITLMAVGAASGGGVAAFVSVSTLNHTNSY